MTPMISATATGPRQRYERDGFVIARGLFDPSEIRDAAGEAEALFQRTDLISTRNLRCRWRTDPSGECRFETFDPVIDISPGCARLAADRRLLAFLEELYGDRPCLFKDKLIFKWPGCDGYGLHQDWIAWDGFPRSFLTVVIPFDEADADNGCTEVFPGYHHNGPLTPEDGQYRELPAGTVDESLCVPLELKPGDVAVFTGFTPHRSAPNRSGRWRRQLFLSYNRAGDGGDQRTKHYQDFEAWLRRRYAEYGKTEVYFE
jgi:hypothetical protein